MAIKAAKNSTMAKNKSPKANTLKTPEPKKPVQKIKSATPQPQPITKNTPKQQKKLPKTPKSEPQPKRKKIADELDEELSDEDFEALLKHVAKKEELNKGKKRSAPADEDEDDDISDLEDDDDDDDDDDEEDVSGDEDLSGDEDEENSDEEEDSEDEAPPAKKVKKTADDTKTSVAVTDTKKGSEPEDKSDESASISKSKKKRERAKKLKDMKVAKVKNALKEELDTDAARRMARDSRSLFIKNMPPESDEAALRALHPAIQEVRMHLQHKKKGKTEKKANLQYAFLEFADESTTDKAHADLQGKQVGNKTLVVDFVGSKSKLQKKDSNRDIVTAPVDPLKLYVSCLPDTTTKDSLKALFPASIDIHLPIRNKTGKPCGYAFIFFSNSETAKAAHTRLHDSEVEGHKLVVLFAKKTKDEAGSRKEKPAKSANDAQSADDKKKKKQSPATKQNDEDDDDDDEEDMEEDDDEDEDDINAEVSDDDDDDEDDDDQDDDGDEDDEEEDDDDE